MKNSKSVNVINKSGSWGGAYFLTFMGALFYFVGNTDGIWNILIAVLKASVWPALVVHQILPILRL